MIKLYTLSTYVKPDNLLQAPRAEGRIWHRIHLQPQSTYPLHAPSKNCSAHLKLNLKWQKYHLVAPMEWNRVVPPCVPGGFFRYIPYHHVMHHIFKTPPGTTFYNDWGSAPIQLIPMHCMEVEFIYLGSREDRDRTGKRYRLIVNSSILLFKRVEKL